jgi:hypothetical protein
MGWKKVFRRFLTTGDVDRNGYGLNILTPDWPNYT